MRSVLLRDRELDMRCVFYGSLQTAVLRRDSFRYNKFCVS
jgi:hypothetical protein